MNLLETIKKFFFPIFYRRNKVIATPVNDGLILEPPPVGAWMLGAGTWKDVKPLVPDMNWRPYIFLNESQKKRSRDTFSCVSFAVLNIIELIVYRKYGVRLNFSDRFTAKMSNTKPGVGNTFNNVLESGRKDGCVSEEKWPFTEDMVVPDEFFAEIPAIIKALGQEFLKEWNIAYWYVSRKEFNEGLKVSPLLIAVHAWWKQNGLYISPDDRPQNHATTLIQPNLSVFDSYDPFIKQLHPSHRIYEYGVVIDVTKRVGSSEGEKLYNRFLNRVILLAQAKGELYRLLSDHLKYIPITIGDSAFAQGFSQYLKDRKLITGITNEHFELIKSYYQSTFGSVEIEQGEPIGVGELLKQL